MTNNHKQQNQQDNNSQADDPLTMGFHDSNSIAPPPVNRGIAWGLPKLPELKTKSRFEEALDLGPVCLHDVLGPYVPAAGQ